MLINFNKSEKIIDKEMAEALDMTMWEGMDGQWYARQINNDQKRSPFFGYVFTIIK